MGKEILQDTDWTKLIQPAGPDWTLRRVNSPVVKIIHGDGSFFGYGVVGALITRGKNAPYVCGIEHEVASNGVPSCILGDIGLSEIKKGEINMKGGQVLKIEFDGLASDEKHKERKWSYWF